MKAKIVSIVLLMSLSVALMGQTTEKSSKKEFRGAERGTRMNSAQGVSPNGLNLTDVQKEAFKQSMLALQKQLQPLRNAMGEAEAHQKTLVTAEKPDLAAINKNIEKIGAIRIEMAKVQAKHHLDMRVQLTDEQRLKFDMSKDMMMHQKGSTCIKNMKQARGMQSPHPMM